MNFDFGFMEYLHVIMNMSRYINFSHCPFVGSDIGYLDCYKHNESCAFLTLTFFYCI